tara:strand:+ start:127 stop:477 length:351 start_codon:yes stop_codon:yes gene_type:complete
MTNKADQLYENVFLYSINFSYVLYIFILFGVGGFAPQYLEILKGFLKIFVGTLLFIRYNPFTYKEKKFGEFDRKLVFSSSIFLLLSTAFISGIENYIQIKSEILFTPTINRIKSFF